MKNEKGEPVLNILIYHLLSMIQTIIVGLM